MDRYLYLIYSLIFLALLAGILRVRKDLWHVARPFIIGGAIVGPLSELLFFRDYWRPEDLAGRGHMSIEDMIFGACVYSLAAITFPFCMRRRVSISTTRRRASQRAGLVVAVTIAGVLLLNLVLGLNSIVAFTMAMAFWWGYMVIRRRDLILPSGISAAIWIVCVTIGYIVGLDFIAPNVLSSWWLLNGSTLGLTIFGNVPITELAWFSSLTAYTSALYMYATDGAYAPGMAIQRTPADLRPELTHPVPHTLEQSQNV